MKRSLIFTIALLSSFGKLLSCGYWPYGEDIRYSLFLPDYFNYKEFEAFNYNSELFGFDYEYQNQYESNVYDWYNYLDKKVSIEEINNCLNTLKLTDININSSNQLVQFLYKNRRKDLLQYLLTAKKCEDFSSMDVEDPWERNETIALDYLSFLKKLNQKIETEKNSYLKRKYAFLTIRTAYYGYDYELIHNLFQTHFANGEKDYLYYWALFFNSFHNKEASVDIANIMAYSPEKKYAAFYYFHKQFDLKEALTKVKSPKDVANIYAFASVQRLQPNLDYLKKIYENSKHATILDFLLLREINKIEDWVYTPYYTNYLPSIEYAEYAWSEPDNTINSTETLRARSEKDRLYAKEVLDFVNTADLSKVNDQKLWKAVQIQLLFITRNYSECLARIGVFEKSASGEKFWRQIEKIKALCIISDQEYGKAVINADAQALILKHRDDKRFLFSAGRELEFRGNLPDGLALISYANKKIGTDWENYYYGALGWQSNRLKNSGNLVYFYEYFDYVDFVYSADELKIAIAKLDSLPADDFTTMIYGQLLSDRSYLKDLLGTKYIREERLQEAENTFRSIGQTYWDENYNAWERDRYEREYVFEINPFYDLNYTDPFIPHAEKYLVTKLSVTQHLIRYTNIANNPKTKNKDYYYFIVANCYLNMTQYGNAWMMRRYSSGSGYEATYEESYIDEPEYRNAKLAKKYYHLAFENAKTDKFRALCLRMEDYAAENYTSEYPKLKAAYPEYYEDLFSSCFALEDYFKSRR